MSRLLAIWLLLYVGGLLLAVVHPIYPVMSYLTFYYAPPHVNWWGRYLPDLRFSLLASAGILGSLALRQSSLEPLAKDKNPALPWLLVFGLNTVVVTLWALDHVRSWAWTVTFLKLVLLYMLLPAAIRTPAQFDMFGTAHVAGATYWGYKGWDHPKRQAGRLEEVGGSDTQNDNQAAGHLLTVIPFVALYALTERRRWRQGLYAVAGAFIVNVFILCNSRGATLGLLASGLSAIVVAGKGRRLKLVGAAVIGGFVLLMLADPEFIRRQQTTANPEDNSAQSRLVTWVAGFKMVKDHPLGAGGRAFHILSPGYIPDIVAAHGDEERSAHNSYVQLATEWGVQGTLLWLGFMGATFLMLRRVKARAGGDAWFANRALVLQTALIGTLTAAVFSNRLYGESIYWMCALTFTLHRLQCTALQGIVPVAAPALPASPLAPALAAPAYPLGRR